MSVLSSLRFRPDADPASLGASARFRVSKHTNGDLASNYLLLLVRRTAARGIGAGRIDRGAAFLDIDDLPFLVHDESGTIGNPGLGYENAVSGGHFAI